MRRPSTLAAALTVLAVSLLFVGSAASQESEAQPPVTPDVSGVSVEIAIAPNPPVVGEEVMLISRLTGPADQVATVESWRFEWRSGLAGADATKIVGTEVRELTKFSQARGRRFVLTVCPSPESPSCLKASAEATATEVGNRPGTIELDVGSTGQTDEPLTATLTSPDVEILGTYFELRDLDRDIRRDSHLTPTIDASPPGNAPSFDFLPPKPSRYEVVAAACYLAPGLVCQTTRRTVTIERSGCDTSSDPLTRPGDVRLETYPDGRTRLQWVDGNSTETGYRVRAGDSLSTLEPFAEFPCNAQGIPLPTDAADRPECFEVTAVGRDGESQPASTCQSPTELTSDVYLGRTFVAEIVDAWTNPTSERDVVEVRFIAPPSGDSYFYGEREPAGFWVTARTVRGHCLEDSAVYVDAEDDLYELSRPNPNSSIPLREYSVLLPGMTQQYIGSVQVGDSTRCSRGHFVGVPPMTDAPSASAESTGSNDILIAPYPPVVGETVLFALRQSDNLPDRRWWYADDESVYALATEGGPTSSITGRLKRAGTHTITVRECGGNSAECTVIAERTFEGTTINTRPAVDLALEVSDTEPIRGEPLSITARTVDGTDIAETFMRVVPNGDGSGVTSSATHVTSLETVGVNTVKAAVCLDLASEPTCELLTTEVVVERPGPGTAAAPAPATDLVVDDWLSSSGGRRLRWTDTNQLESGYRVSSGPSLDALTLLGEYPRNTSGVFSADPSHNCFEVRVVFDEDVGPPATHCRPESLPEPPPPAILTLAEPVVGEPVTFYANGIRTQLLFDWDPGPGLTWRYGDPLIGATTEATNENTFTFEAPGTYEVSAEDENGLAVTTMVEVRAAPTKEPSKLRAPRNVEHFAERDHVTFIDTNADEDGYRVAIVNEGTWIGHTGANATSAELNATVTALSDPYVEIRARSICIEVRAFKDNVLGPATLSCTGSDSEAVTDVAVSPGAEPGELRVQFSHYVGSNRARYRLIGAADVNVELEFEDFLSPGNGRCNLAWSWGLDAFDYETGVPGLDLTRTETVTIYGLTTGRTYGVGFYRRFDYRPYEYDQDQAHAWACTPHPDSPEVVAP